MILVIPRATEKAYAQQTQRIYMFTIPRGMSKQLVAKEVTEQFKVTVLGVRIINRIGKSTKFRRGRHAYPGTTYRQNKKVAYVTLKDGDKIKVFDEEPIADKKQSEDATKNQSLTNTSGQESTKVKKAGLFTRKRTGNRGDK